MDTLGYKTRAGSAPNGKPRVYLCCHPEDCSIYLEPMAQELLERSGRGELTDEELKRKLAEL